jgi:hypothetical protein
LLYYQLRKTSNGMTIGDYINNVFMAIGSIAVAVTLLYCMWFFIVYVFLGSDDQERAHAKHKLLYGTITLMFIMIFWGAVSMTGRVLGL